AGCERRRRLEPPQGKCPGIGGLRVRALRGTRGVARTHQEPWRYDLQLRRPWSGARRTGTSAILLSEQGSGFNPEPRSGIVLVTARRRECHQLRVDGTETFHSRHNAAVRYPTGPPRVSML